MLQKLNRPLKIYTFRLYSLTVQAFIIFSLALYFIMPVLLIVVLTQNLKEVPQNLFQVFNLACMLTLTIIGDIILYFHKFVDFFLFLLLFAIISFNYVKWKSVREHAYWSVPAQIATIFIIWFIILRLRQFAH